MTTKTLPSINAGRGLHIGLWIVQLLLAAAFVNFGFMKLTMPIAELSKMMAWTATFPPGAVRAIGAIDIAGGLGLVLPALLRIRPQLTVLAALGCMVLQVCAMVLHGMRGELQLLPLNIVLFALASFVWWGRGKKAPIASR